MIQAWLKTHFLYANMKNTTERTVVNMIQKESDFNTLRFKVEEYFSNVHFDTQTCTPTNNKLTQDYFIKLLSKLVVSICSAWYAIQEIINFIQKRKDLKGFTP